MCEFIEFLSEPKDLHFSYNLTEDSYATCLFDNSFCVFKSINNILYLIYVNDNKSIISYDLNNMKKVNQIKSPHNDYISYFRHYLDKINKRDLLMTISCYENHLKIWNINNWDILVNLKKVNDTGYLNSACFLNEMNHIYIITSNFNYSSAGVIKVLDFNGNKIKEINNSNEPTYFIDNYYDNKLSINYIFAGNNGYIKSYNYNENKIYHKYYDIEEKNQKGKGHSSIIISIEDIIKLIESCFDGKIRIWDFHTGILLNKINVCNEWLRGICLWNKNYLFVGCDDKTIKLIDLNKNIIIKDLIKSNRDMLAVKKIYHYKYGECLVSQGWKDEQIKLWMKKK